MAAPPPYAPAGPPGGAPPPGGFYPPPQQMQMQPQYPPPVTQQPGFYPVVPPQQGPPMGAPPPQMQQVQLRPDNCPPGLEYLTQVDQIIVKQKVEIMEALFGCETKNKYKLKNSMGQEIYSAKEDTDCCTRNVCGPIRPFGMTIKDNNDQEVIYLNRPLNCQSACFPCCLQHIEVQSPPGTVIGTVDQDWTFCNPSFTIKDQNGEVALTMEGPCLTYSFCGDVEFKVLSPDGSTEVGKISKQWSGLLREAFTDSDNFGISFPMDLDVRMKATLIGAMFLIDFMFFEKKGNEEQDGIGMF